MNLTGKVSWFGGPHDPTDSGHTASGGTTKEPGIAVYNHGTLGGYWRVTGPNGRTAILRQTDIGPAPWTGRKIDVTYSALGKFGFNESNFPTDSQFKATYLGRNPPKEAGGGSVLPAQPVRTIKTVPGTPSREVAEVDQPAFEKAKKAALVGRLLASEGGQKENPLFASGLVSTKEPLASEFTQQRTIPGTPAREVNAPASPAGPRAPGTKLGGFLAGSAPLQMRRIDQGQDIQTRPGEALLAPGDGIVVAVKSDPSGFGPDYPVVKFTSGPLAGQSWYLGHTDAALRAGEHFRAGQPIARTSKTGHNAPPGWAEIGFSSALGQGIKNQGVATRRYLK